MRRAQVAFEYMMVIALLLALFIPFTFVFFNQTKEVEEETAKVQLDSLAKKISAYGDELYYSGGFSKRTIKTYLPSKVTSFRIDGDVSKAENKQIVFTVQGSNGVQDIVYFSKVPIYMPTKVEGEKVKNMHSIFLAKRQSDDLATSLVLCTNLDQSEDCAGIAES